MASTKETPFGKHRAEFREQVSTLGHDVQELSKVTKNLANDTLNMLSDNASGYYKEGMEKVQGLEKNLEGKIRNNPLQSVLIAAGIGLILGAFWRRR
jgi:ElaB/YqjD/DUF883 family membrane-anchored ribosome-binding protein